MIMLVALSKISEVAWGYNIGMQKQDDQVVDIHGNEFNIHVYNSKRNK